MAKPRSDLFPLPTFGDHPAECLNCGYDLQGLTDPPCCPECGVEVRDPTWSGVLFTAGVPQLASGGSARWWVRVLTLGGWLIVTRPATWFMFWAFGGGWIPMLLLTVAVGASAWLYFTGPRRYKVAERLIFTCAGFGRVAFGSSQRLGFVAWNRDEVVQARPIGSVWQKLIIRRRTPKGRLVKILEYGFRCHRDQIEPVRAIVEALARDAQVPAGAVQTLIGVPPGLPGATHAVDRVQLDRSPESG